MAGNRKWDDLINEWEPAVRRAFLESVQAIRDNAQIGVIEAALRRGDVEAALEAVGIDPALFRPLDKALAAAFEDGGEFTLRNLPALREAGKATVRVVFDVRNQRAESYLKERSSNLVREIVSDQRQMVREHLRAGMEAGINPRDTARDLVGRIDIATGKRSGGAVGLTASQEQWVRNYRAKLSDPARITEALDNKLRDKRFDATVAKAARDGTPIPAEKIEAMVRNYRNRALKYRADSIARTEALRSLNASQIEAANQGVEGGQFAPGAVTKVWIATKDARVRDSHRALDGQEVALNGSFVTPSGARLRYPLDETAPASETVQCRCFMRLKTDFLKGLR